MDVYMYMLLNVVYNKPTQKINICKKISEIFVDQDKAGLYIKI